jgi:hypothetical protein
MNFTWSMTARVASTAACSANRIATERLALVEGVRPAGVDVQGAGSAASRAVVGQVHAAACRRDPGSYD